MENLPKDPFILLSFINMKLRDEYSSLDELCTALDIDRNHLEEILKNAGFSYDDKNNHFTNVD